MAGRWGSLASVAGLAGAATWRWGDHEGLLGLRGGEGREREGRNGSVASSARHLRARRCGSVVGARGAELSVGAVEAPGPEAQRGGSCLQTQPSRPCGSHRPGGSEQHGGWGVGGPCPPPAPPAPRVGTYFSLEAGDHDLSSVAFISWQPSESQLPGALGSGLSARL